MKFITLFSFVVTLALTSFCARAEDPPPPGPGSAATQQQQQQQDPAPLQQQTQQPKVTGRKEDEDENAPKSKGFSLASLKQYLPTTRKGAGNAHARVAELEAENKTLNARIKALEDGSALKALQTENARLTTDLEGFAIAAQERGMFDENEAAAPEAQSKAGQAVNNIINGRAAQELRAIGHKPKDPNAKHEAPKQAAGDGKPLSRQEQAAANAEYWAQRKATWATAGNN